MVVSYLIQVDFEILLIMIIYFASALRGGSQENLYIMLEVSPSVGQYYAGPAPIFATPKFFYYNSFLATMFAPSSSELGYVNAKRVDLTVSFCIAS